VKYTPCLPGSHSKFRDCHSRSTASLSAFLGLIWVATSCLPVAIADAAEIAPTVSFTLQDGPGLDGVADDIFEPGDTKFGEVNRNEIFDAEHYVEFSLSGAEPATAALLELDLYTSILSFPYGESKTFSLSTYQGTGQVTADVFEYGEYLYDELTLATLGAHELDLDVTDAWNAAVAAGDGFFGVRIHDPVCTDSVGVGCGVVDVLSATISGVTVPEPSPPLLAGAALLTLALLTRSRRRS